jgi:hypothetical protein
MDSVHLSITIDCHSTEAYDFARDVRNLPLWAAGLTSSIHEENGMWVSESPMGRSVIEFADVNTFGVLDHIVTVESGERFYNPMRVIPLDDACEVVFTLRRSPTVSDSDFQRDRTAVEADLATLKQLLEA